MVEGSSRKQSPARKRKHALSTTARAAQKGKSMPVPEPDARQQQAIAQATDLIRKRRDRISVNVENTAEHVMRISCPHSDIDGQTIQLLAALGTSSLDFLNASIARIGAIVKRRGAEFPTGTEFNAALAAIDGLQPGDEIEAMLAIQMIATHECAMEMLTRAKQAEFMPALQECGGLAIKLLRTYAAQVEALGRLRRGGEQRVIVQHVNVNDGGQAIVGALNQAGGERK